MSINLKKDLKYIKYKSNLKKNEKKKQLENFM